MQHRPTDTTVGIEQDSPGEAGTQTRVHMREHVGIEQDSVESRSWGYCRSMNDRGLVRSSNNTISATQADSVGAVAHNDTRNGTRSLSVDDRLPVKMLNDRVLVKLGDAEGERRSSGGILIPATAQVGKRLAWAEVVAAGPNVRNMETGDQVLFNPEDRYEVEVRGTDYIILRERDVHAVAAQRLDEGSTGLYL